MIRENLIAIGKRIKEIRKHLRITQKEMASELNMSACYLSEIEGGKGNPGHTFFYQLSTRYHVNLNYLFHGDGEMFTRNKFIKKIDKNENLDEIESIDELYWYLENSSLLRSHLIGSAAKFICENEDIIRKNIERHISKKKNR